MSAADRVLAMIDAALVRLDPPPPAPRIEPTPSVLAQALADLNFRLDRLAEDEPAPRKTKER